MGAGPHFPCVEWFPIGNDKRVKMLHYKKSTKHKEGSNRGNKTQKAITNLKNK